MKCEKALYEEIYLLLTMLQSENTSLKKEVDASDLITIKNFMQLYTATTTSHGKIIDKSIIDFMNIFLK